MGRVLVLLVLSLFMLTGCTSVKPWQKGKLAKRYMAFDPNPLDAKFMRHTYESREGSRGGYGAAAGGCGCN